MIHKYYLIPALLGFAGLLMTANAAHSQHGHGGASHGGAHHGGTSHGHAYHHGGHYSPSIRIGVGLYGGAYPYSYAYGPYIYPSVAPPLAYYPEPMYAVQVPPPPVLASNTAGIRVLVPDANAKVWFDGTLTSQTGTDRLYRTPSLAAGGSYRIRASWTQSGQPVTQEQVVPVTPGQTATVDFTRPASEPVPAPKQ